MAGTFAPSPYCNKSILEKLHECPTFDCVFSRIYDKSNIECKHISGNMAQRLYYQSHLLHDEVFCAFKDFVINGHFRDWNDPSHVFIPKSYINFMCKCDKFPSLMKHALERVISRLIKGLGLKCNCIADKVIVWVLICQAQFGYISNDESVIRDRPHDNWINSWSLEKKNQDLDTNFMLLYETELGIKVDRNINNPKVNTYLSTIVRVQKDIEIGWRCQYGHHDNKIKKLYKDDTINVGELYLRQLNSLFDDERTRHHIVDWDNPLIRNDLLKSMKVNKTHPTKWFEPFDMDRIFDFYYVHIDYRRVKVRKRCMVCLKRKSKRKGIRLMRCKGCKHPNLYRFYCSRKCQKYHWKYHHRTLETINEHDSSIQ